jgi:hypothetical protein
VHSAVAACAVLMQLHSAMTQRKVLRRRGGGEKARASGAADVNVNANANIDADTSTASGDEASLHSNLRPGTETETHISHLPQPLLVSTSPVLSTLAWVWIIPVVYLTIGGMEALLSGSLVGLIVGAVYNAGYFKMSTWTPFLWGLINCLIVILGSFRIQGGL